jgi:phage/plasmid-like protein (TIGR03299 family)
MKAAIYHTAGALNDGKRIWILARLPGAMRVVGDDISEKYLLLANGHDGATSVQMKFTSVRVVCQNTLALALKGTPAQSVHNGAHFWKRMDDAREALGIINAGFATLDMKFQGMARVKLHEVSLARYLEVVFPTPPENAPDWRKDTARRDRAECTRLFETGLGNDRPQVRGTLWAALSGVTEYVDHFRGAADGRDRLSSIWFGEARRTKALAYHAACDYMAAKLSS